MTFVLLITAPHTHSNAWHAYYFAETALRQGHSLHLFFYSDGVRVANRLNYYPQGEQNLAECWQTLKQQYALSLSVCITASLKHGLSDVDNSHRHHLLGDNLHPAFELVGLGTLTDVMLQSDRLISFIGA
ncbi:sulfurtransferase complex subunit TusD [Agitococcus lubricus]|uniref:tRNA 2-thiouridine synthesizing protein D n=1 Tax=Agitococcus lubricus TaxID=1077255 RepID=A0A2T5IWU7_9GAMM|nr:sulfurtransferase complex subunit TusD [Agitococcus lubricus]PTQ88299.1 tRNA 2-thiouridine synthesizing protein D [Agitococcus lubricus]